MMWVQSTMHGECEKVKKLYMSGLIYGVEKCCKDGREVAGNFAPLSVCVSRAAREERANGHQMNTSCVKRR